MLKTCCLVFTFLSVQFVHGKHISYSCFSNGKHISYSCFSLDSTIVKIITVHTYIAQYSSKVGGATPKC